uniref:uncharacterized protein LOC130474494 n=1 Tax=Euleptes europaea TaxID=460621 RepID=UPI0025423E49|nr:uncharacterized protein LOC130474494 [Euleptes europaea]
MAPRQQGKNKTKRIQKKKPQKKGQQARKKQKRLQPKKQKKRQATKVGSRAVLSSSSPRIFAAKILRHMPKVRMENKAKRLMKTLLMDVYEHMSKVVENQSQNNESPTIDPNTVQTVFQEAMTRQLAEHSAEPASSETPAA